MHRVGRTARANREGDALMFLESHEEEYVDLLRKRQVPLTATSVFSSNVSATALTQRLREIAREDRHVMELAQRAFVSQVRAYMEHQCKYIFQINHLKLYELANCLGLLFVSAKHHRIRR